MNDILYDVLSHLPAKCVLRFRTVCQTWKLIIEDPSFIKSHTKKQQSCASSTFLIRNDKGGGCRVLPLHRLMFADGVQKIDGVISLKQIIHRGVPRMGTLPVPVCNGLILITPYDKTHVWIIWNPLVEDYHVIRPPPRSLTGPMNEYCVSSSGIGYDEATDDYKVVRIGEKRFEKGQETLIYTLKLPFWRAIKGFPSEVCFGAHGVYLNGVLHWRSRDAIIAFHVGKESYTLLPRPPYAFVDGCWEELHALDGCLIFSCRHYGQNDVSGWVMNEYGSSWRKLFSFHTTMSNLRVVGYLKSPGQVFFKHSGGSLVWLDLKARSAKNALINGLPNDSLSFSQFNPCSILRLDYTKSGSVKRRLHQRSSLEFSLSTVTV